MLETYTPVQVAPCHKAELWRHAIDHKNKEYIDLEEIEVNSNYEKPNREHDFKLDPLPILLAPSRYNPRTSSLGDGAQERLR